MFFYIQPLLLDKVARNYIQFVVSKFRNQSFLFFLFFGLSQIKARESSYCLNYCNLLDDFQIGNCVTFEFFYSLTSLQVPEGDSGVCAAGEEDTPVCGEVEVHDGSSVTCHYCNILTFSVDVPQDCNEYQFLHEATQQIKLFKLIVEFFIDLFLCGIKNIINDILL